MQMLPIGWVAISLLALAHSGAVGAQASSMAARYDSLARRMLHLRHPCPNPVPAGWTAADRSNGSGVRCSLVVAAARGATVAMRAKGRADMNPDQVLCVALSPAKPHPSIAPLWRVDFYTDSVRGAEVQVDPYGQTVTVRMIVSLEAPIALGCKPAV